MNSAGPPKRKVSVIIPTYNRAKFIRSAIGSVIDQKYPDIEIIVVDDGSEDDTRNVVQSLQKCHPGIIYCQNERSKGPSGARNTGIKKASGDYISFLDSDDMWLDGHLEKGLEVLDKHPEVDVFFGNFSVADHETGNHRYNFFDQKELLHALKATQISHDNFILQDDLFVALVQENFIHFASMLIRKPVMNGIMLDEAITYAEDRDFAIQLFKKAKATFAYSRRPVFTLYTHESSLCSTSKDTTQIILNSHIHLLRKYLTQYELTVKERRVLTKILAVKLSNTAYLYGRRKDYKSAFSSVLSSFNYDLTISQIRDLLKILMTVVYVPRTTHTAVNDH